MLSPQEPGALCQCNCGQPAPIARKTSRRQGHIKGQPIRFVNGHGHVIALYRPEAERFWEKSDRGTDPDACRVWAWLKEEVA